MAKAKSKQFMYDPEWGGSSYPAELMDFLLQEAADKPVTIKDLQERFVNGIGRQKAALTKEQAAGLLEDLQRNDYVTRQTGGKYILKPEGALLGRASPLNLSEEARAEAMFRRKTAAPAVSPTEPLLDQAPSRGKQLGYYERIAEEGKPAAKAELAQWERRRVAELSAKDAVRASVGEPPVSDAAAELRKARMSRVLGDPVRAGLRDIAERSRGGVAAIVGESVTGAAGATVGGAAVTGAVEGGKKVASMLTGAGGAGAAPAAGPAAAAAGGGAASEAAIANTIVKQGGKGLLRTVGGFAARAALPLFAAWTIYQIANELLVSGPKRKREERSLFADDLETLMEQEAAKWKEQQKAQALTEITKYVQDSQRQELNRQVDADRELLSVLGGDAQVVSRLAQRSQPSYAEVLAREGLL